jgi:hypothetical protein
MTPKFLNKKFFFVLGFVVLIILLLGGFFLWKDIEKQSPYKTLWENEYVQDKEFEVKETADGKIIENKEEGLIIKGPSNWSVVKEGDDIAFASPEVEFDEKGHLIFSSIKEKGGCGVVVQIIKCKKVDPDLTTDAEYLSGRINLIKEDEKYKEEMKNHTPRNEVILLSGKEGRKATYIKDGSIRMIEIEIPIGQTIYSFSSGLIMDQKCVDSFNDILSTVLISK